MFGREVYALLDVVLGQPHQESTSWKSANDFATARQRTTSDVYTRVREHLGVQQQQQ